ncbi:MAG: DUF2306 domain-containing protein [Sporocytophaga sp.]|nr:DUF2306 domain-containing protein [Sporocytophaga sp.]
MIFTKSLEYYSPDFQRGYLLDKKEVFDGIFKYGLYAHITTVPIILLIGSSQAFFRYEKSNKRIHRVLGSIYIYLILFLSAPGAFIISFYAFGGWPAKVSFLTLTILWAWFTYQGLRYGKNKNVIAHKNFMIRSYVLTLSAITLRLLSFIFIHYFNFYGELAYALSAWLSWLPVLILTEFFIRIDLTSINLR